MSTIHSREDASHAESVDTSRPRPTRAFDGVKGIEGTYVSLGIYSKYILFAALSMLVYLCSLGNMTTFNYVYAGLFDFDIPSSRVPALVNIFNVLPIIPIAVYFLFVKVADVKSRSWAFATSLICYVLGYIIVAAAHSLDTVAAGLVINYVGYGGLQVSSNIIIADFTTLKWRGLVSSAVSLLTIINDFVYWKIVAEVEVKAGWRWGVGMFTIIVPAVVAPILFVLIRGKPRAKKTGGLDITIPSQTFSANLIDILHRFDIIGLLILVTSIILILFPLNYASTARGYLMLFDDFWKDPSKLAMFICGLFLIPVFMVWERMAAKYPVIPRAVGMNWTVLAAVFVVFLDAFSYWIFFSYFAPIIGLQKPNWTTTEITNFGAIPNVSLPVFGLVAGIGMRIFKRYKPFLIAGLAIRTIGIGIMVHSRGGDASDQEVLASQVLQGIGSAFVLTTALVAAQASVPHINVAVVTALIMTASQAGLIIGVGIAEIIYTAMFPAKVMKYIPRLNPAQLESLGTHYPNSVLGARILGLVEVYADILGTLAIIATSLSVVTFMISLTMRDTYLGDTQNAVDGCGLDGTGKSKVGSDTDSGSERQKESVVLLEEVGRGV